VKPNENLGILSTVRDSLSSQVPSTDTVKKDKGPRTILGMSMQRFAIVASLSLAALFGLVKLTLRMINRVKRSRRLWHQQEAYWYKRFAHSGNNLNEVIQTFYDWWIRTPGEPTTLNHSGVSKDTVKDWLKIQEAWTAKRNENVADFKKMVDAERTKRLKRSGNVQTIDDRQRIWEG
jgi:hypothetical protein